MKKISIICIAALAAAACNKGNVAPEVAYTEITAVNSDVNRTHLDQMSVIWDAGDAINIFLNEESYKFTTTQSGANVKFKGAEMKLDDKTYALFPYCDTASFSQGVFRVPVYSTEQQVKDGSFTSKANIAVGKCDNLTSTTKFITAGALLKFQLGQEGADTLKRIEIKANNGETIAIAGAASVSYNDGNPTIAAAAGATTSDVITLTPEGNSFATGDTYYVWVLPGSYSKGISIKLVTNTLMEGEKEGTSALTLARNSIVDLGEIKGITFKKKAETKKIVFDFSSTTPMEGWPTNSVKAWTTASRDTLCTYATGGTDYTFRLYYPPIQSTTTGQITWDSDGKGLVLWTKFRYVGLPKFTDMKLIIVDIVQGTAPNTSRKGAITTDTPTSDPKFVKGGETQIWSGSNITYTLENTAADTEYFLACINSGIGAKKLTLTYEKVKQSE